MAMAAAAHPTAEGLARLGELREEAYTKVLRAFTQQTFHWGREKVLGSLRKELHIGNDAHAEIMDCVLNGKVPPRLAAAATVRADARHQPGGPSSMGRSQNPQTGHGHAYSGHDSMAVPDGGSGIHRRQLGGEASPLGMPPIPTSPPGGGGYPAHAAHAQHAGSMGRQGHWQRGGLSPHQRMAQQQQQRVRQAQHGGYMQQHPQEQLPSQQHAHYGSPAVAQQRSGGFPQLPHHQMQPSPQGGRPSDYAPTYLSPMDGGGHPMPPQHQQQRYGGPGAARELWPPQQQGRQPGSQQQQYSHHGMAAVGGGGQYMDPYSLAEASPGDPGFDASPGGGSPGQSLRGGGGSGSVSGAPRYGGQGKPGRGRPPLTKKRPASEGATPPKQPKKKKGEGSPALPPTSVQAPIAAAAALKLDPLLGHRVKVYWAEHGGWWDGVVTDFNVITGQHCVVYEYGTPDESFEWTQIRGATGGEVQVLDETVDLMQGRPHGAGVPHDASHAALAQQPPPKAAAKPGRKPKAAPAADGGGSVPNGRHYPAARAPPPQGRPQAPNGLAHGGNPSYGAADAYREQYAHQPPAAMRQQPYQRARQPPAPVRDDGYGFRVVGQNTDSESDEDYSNESYD